MEKLDLTRRQGICSSFSEACLIRVIDDSAGKEHARCLKPVFQTASQTYGPGLDDYLFSRRSGLPKSKVDGACKRDCFASTVVFLAIGFYLLPECKFLIPYRSLLFHDHGMTILIFAMLLFGNLLAGFFALGPRFFLKDTGKKLAHIEKQLRGRESISEELTTKIREEK